MAHPGFGHLWQQAELSDVDIVISYAQAKGSGGDEDPEALDSCRTLLRQFPGHSPLLSLSPYFVAQASVIVFQTDHISFLSAEVALTLEIWHKHRSVPLYIPIVQALRWSNSSEAQCSTHWQTDCLAIDTASSSQQSTKQVHITLPDASYEPAAVAVLAGMYHMKPWRELLADLAPQQQVQAAVLADMWQLPAAREAEVEVLQEETVNGDSDDRVPAVLEELLSMEVVPDCLMGVFEQALLSKYGDLEAVWAPSGGSLQKALLKLPLHAVELLLASDKLKVRWCACNAAFMVAHHTLPEGVSQIT
jgi:hypothetical protein